MDTPLLDDWIIGLLSNGIGFVDSTGMGDCAFANGDGFGEGISEYGSFNGRGGGYGGGRPMEYISGIQVGYGMD